MKRNVFFAGLALAVLMCGFIAAGCSGRLDTRAGDDTKRPIKVFSYEKGNYVMSETVVKSVDEWKKLLTPDQFHVLREKGTEPAFTGRYANHHEHGIYRCAGCGLDLYRSEDKFESGTGWPSFSAPISPENITAKVDDSLFMRRTEVLCRRCGGHLGHVFDDGPKPSGLRYCLNSAALQFSAAK
ncbi:MAG: peptide-methionine (R)-S-oxide reductase MsrB [Steroidobacteraceae bacterium]|nr:peptide-methionine (R)-S-oxide reductase MsrB [Deltaproteobacteria bacterium]